jgi:hypothetical protein
MGVHIILYRLKLERDEHGYLASEDDVSEEFNWDIIRRTGDKEFASSDNFNSVADRIPNSESYFHRPSSFENTKMWVRNYIVAPNQKRLLDILEIMGKDESLYFCFAW